jgi:circadian clock protein KaiA
VSLRPQLSVCIFVRCEELADTAIELLEGDRYVLTQIESAVDLFGFLKHNYHLDCLVFEADGDLRSVTDKLQERSLFLPAVIFSRQPGEEGGDELLLGDGGEAQASTPQKGQHQSCSFFYHAAEVHLPIVRESIGRWLNF